MSRWRLVKSLVMTASDDLSVVCVKELLIQMKVMAFSFWDDVKKMYSYWPTLQRNSR